MYPLGTNSYPLGMNSYPLGTNSYPVMDQPVFWGLLCSRGSDRLTSTAQPGLGGKRSDSSKVGVTSAVTELMQAIDREPNNLIEKKSISSSRRPSLHKPDYGNRNTPIFYFLTLSI